ncbi:hypothetical protein [Streptomyces sp. NRRL B-3229]|uniref:hypothetical protein n=1 Tax=Streptomyces sp. NRRL B-3229 TaxID=1463836 RepID=UPI0007C45F17|nr:hypothetical protein [Streptomyces sp. NRRL B-3229]
MAEQKSSQQAAHTSPDQASEKEPPQLPQPLRAAVSALGKVPGAGTVGRVAGGALDRVAAVSPRGRRFAVYAGAGVLGVAGIVEWPIAVTGAAVAWLTQPRPGERDASAGPSGDASAALSGDAAGRPTPKVLAASHGSPGAATAAATATSSSPSGKLPPHESPSMPPGQGGPGGSTTGRTRSGH